MSVLVNQRIRAIAPELDPLRMGIGWRAEDLEKPGILIESTFGDRHPGSAHLLALVNRAADGVLRQRRARWQPRQSRSKKGVLKLFAEHAVSPMKGGYMEQRI